MSILFIDSSGGVFETDLSNNTTRQLADYALNWTDNAVHPDGRIFANTFSGLYVLNEKAETADMVLSLSGTANGLATDKDGNIYVSYSSRNRIDVYASDDFSLTRSIELPLGTSSAGDMHIQGDTLYLASSSREIVTIDLATDDVISSEYHGIVGLYGLQYEDGKLYGLARNDVYLLDAETGDAEQVSELPISNVVNGAATLAGVTVRGTRGADFLDADIGGSTLLGFRGRDVLIGDQGQDILRGHSGRDYLFGEGGRDKLYGGSGRDILEGGRGNDVLFGGFGRDVFVFNRRDGHDRIRDFQDDRDTIEIEGSVMGRGPKTVERLLADFGTDSGDNIVFDFGRRGQVTIEDVDNLIDLADDILIF